jgi:hypothetical protein
MGELRILNQRGDETIAWDPGNAKEVRAAKERFDALKKDGFEFYTVEETKGKRVERFSKTLGKVIAAPGGKKEADRASGTRGRAMGGGPTAQVLPTSGW